MTWCARSVAVGGALLAGCLAFGSAAPLIAADPVAAADPFAAREVAPGWILTHFGKGEQRRFTEPLGVAAEAGRFTLKADSGMLFFKRSDEADGVGFVHRPLAGDGSITAKIVRCDDFHVWGGCGVMLRDENVPLGKYLCAMLETVHEKGADPAAKHDSAASIRMRRQVSNEGFRVLRPDTVKLPVWLKVERQGKRFAASSSPDGTTWKLLKETEIEMGPTVSAGLTAWNRYGKGKFGTVVFEDVRVETAPSSR